MPNNQGDSGLQPHHATREAEFAAFDTLPRALREALRTASCKFSAISTRRVYRKLGLKRTLTCLAESGRRAHYHNYPEQRQTAPDLTLHLDL